MKHTRFFAIIACLALLSGATVASAGNISPTDKYAWSETSGWVDFAPTGTGVTVYADHLEGLAWSDAVGWIKLGSHTGGGSCTYANSGAGDWGVNRSGGALSGFAWSETSGWIDLAPTGGGVTINSTTGALDGFAWSDALGWLHFRGTATNADSYGVSVILPILTVTIVGQGTVTSSTSGANYACNTPGVCQPVTFGSGDSVSLSATPSANFGFSSWSGDYISTNNPGSITMDSDKAVTASFDADPALVRISDITTAYYTLISALAACGGDAVILARDVTFGGGLTITGHTITLRGGFSDETFTGSRSGYTTINGTLAVSGGKLIAERVRVGP